MLKSCKGSVANFSSNYRVDEDQVIFSQAKTSTRVLRCRWPAGDNAAPGSPSGDHTCSLIPQRACHGPWSGGLTFDALVTLFRQHEQCHN